MATGVVSPTTPRTPNFMADIISGIGLSVPSSGPTNVSTGYPGTTRQPSPAAPAAGTPAAAAAGPSTLTAENNPDIKFALDKMKGRFDGDGGASMAIDLAGGKLREFSEGERKAAAGRRARMGTSGSGMDGYDERHISDKFQSNLAGAASDIALGRERDKDQIIRDVANTGRSMADVNGQERDRQLALYSATEANNRANQAAQYGQIDAILNMMGKLDSMKLGGGLAAPAPAPVAAAPRPEVGGKIAWRG